MQHQTKHLSKTNHPLVPPRCIIAIQQNNHKQVSMKRLRSTTCPSSYHCPVSKRLDCSGWLSDWPQALAGRVGHCEGRLGNELEQEIQQNRHRLFRATGERQTHWVNWGEERLAGNRQETIKRLSYENKRINRV